MEAFDVSSVNVALQVSGRLNEFTIKFLKKWQAAGKDLVDLVDLVEDELALEGMVDQVKNRVGTRVEQVSGSSDALNSQKYFMQFGRQCIDKKYAYLASRVRHLGYRLPTRSEILALGGAPFRENWQAFLFDEPDERKLYTYFYDASQDVLHLELEHLDFRAVPRLFNAYERFLVVKEDAPSRDAK